MKTLLITGGTRNTGYAVAEKFASEGYSVALTSRDGGAAVRAADAIAKKYSVPAIGLSLDLTDVKRIEKVFEEASAFLGGIGTFVANSAELGIGLDVASSTEEDYYRVTEVNLKGTFFCCREAALIMKKQGGGSIVTLGSVQGEGAVPGRALYSMTKAALKSLVKSLAYEFGGYGIRANNVVCGAIRTSRWDGLDEGELNARRSRYPAGRESTVEEIAEAVWFLGSGSSPTVTGTSLTVDSGLSACLVPYKKPNGGEEK